MAAAVLSLACTASASIGDRSAAYQRCLASCQSTRCTAAFLRHEPRWTLWPCESECKYACLTSLTDLALNSTTTDRHRARLHEPGGPLEGLPAGRQVQFNGKWPFHRWPDSPTTSCWLKMQEPLAVLFSLGNLVMHVVGMRQLASRSTAVSHGREAEYAKAATERLASAYKIYAWSGINAWVWSAVFHTRDVPWTEKADYFAAAGSMLCGMWVAGVRLARLYERQTNCARVATRAWNTVCIVVFVAHCWYLSRGPRFDYTYNMRFNVGVALAQIALWAVWSVRHSRPSSRSRSSPAGPAPHAHLPLIPLLLLPALSALELLDFAPIGPGSWRLLDAHALWHLSTIPVVKLWYTFLQKDLEWVADALDESVDTRALGTSSSKRRLD